jgi:hypothetical protein
MVDASIHTAVMTLRTLADVRKLIRSHSERAARAFNVAAYQQDKTLQECAAGGDRVNISVALRLVLQAEPVPYTESRTAP